MSCKKVICAVDTSNLEEAVQLVKKVSPIVKSFKIGHALTLARGLDVIPILEDAGAERIFLDLKFHDIPNSVGIAVREAAKRNVWMLTVHLSGGPAMLLAAMEEAKAAEQPPMIVGVAVLTSIDEEILSRDLGIPRSIPEQFKLLSQMVSNCDLDGIVCSPHEVKDLRKIVGPGTIIVTPGIRAKTGDTHDQKRVGDAQTAFADGSDFIVVGRALTRANDPLEAMESLGIA